MVAAYFSVEARPDMETITIEVAVQSLQVLLSCELCKAALTNRLRILISRWSAVKVRSITIRRARVKALKISSQQTTI